MASDVEWDIFCDLTECLSPERNVTGQNGASIVMDDDHDSTRNAVQRRPHRSKGGTRKNRKGREWHDIGRIVKARKEAGKESIVSLNGRLIDPSRLQKNISRPMVMEPFEKYGNTPLPAVPRDFAIESPKPQDSSRTWTQELPFIQFQRLVRQNSRPPTYPPELSNPSSDSAVHTISIMHLQIIIPRFKALLPACMLHEYVRHQQETAMELERASGTYFDLLSFSVANNFAGIDGLSPQHALDYLKKQPTTHIDRLIRSIKGRTGRALAEKLFVCAIEAQDAPVVEAILQYKQNTGVDANRSIYEEYGQRYTPIERSAGLRDIATTRVLLKYGADVNTTHDSTFCNGALECALTWPGLDKRPLDVELVELLLHYGAYVNASHLYTATKEHSAAVIQALFRAGIRENHKKWGMSGLFGVILHALDNEAGSALVRLLKQIGADINAPQNRECPTMLDMAAKRGDIGMVGLLLSFGAVQTATTLSYAIRGQDTAMVELFFNKENADGLSCDHNPTTPYAEAIRIGNSSLMKRLDGKNSLIDIKEKFRYLAALHAASEAGNTEVLRRLLHTRTSINREPVLGTALCTATAANHGDVAIMLIHAGANVNVGDGNYPKRTPLEQALENRNPEIVRKILNFGAEFEKMECSPLMLAAKWGEPSIIEDLLVAGCDINQRSRNGETPLTVAIAKRNRRLVKFLLNMGAKVNDADRKGSSPALRKAVSAQDMNTVKDLLSVGADPGDSEALFISCEMWIKSQSGNQAEMTRLLVNEFLKRYPHGNEGSFDAAFYHTTRIDVSIPIRETLKPIIDLKFPGYGQHVASLLAKAISFHNQVSIEALRPFFDSLTDPNAVVGGLENRRPLLSAAIEAKNAQIVQLLLEKGADVNFPATRGIRFTPIQAAAKTGCYEIALMLINRGANVDAPAADVGGGTAIQLAAIGGFLGIAELLLKKGAKVNRAPSIFHGRTALEGAAEWGRLDMVQFLLQFGAQIDGRGLKSFINAMKLAEENGHFVVLELLQSYSS